MTRDAILAMLDALDAQVAMLDTNYVGQEGRGAAADFQRKVRRIIENWKMIARSLPATMAQRDLDGEQLRAFFLEHSWSIQMGDLGGSGDPFTDLAGFITEGRS